MGNSPNSSRKRTPPWAQADLARVASRRSRRRSWPPVTSRDAGRGTADARSSPVGGSGQTGHRMDPGGLQCGGPVEAAEGGRAAEWPAWTCPSRAARPSAGGVRRRRPPPGPGGPAVGPGRPTRSAVGRRRPSDPLVAPRAAADSPRSSRSRVGQRCRCRPRPRAAGPRAGRPGHRAWSTSALTLRRRDPPRGRSRRPPPAGGRRSDSASTTVPGTPRREPSRPSSPTNAIAVDRPRDPARPRPPGHRWRSGGRARLRPSASRTGPG